jgi:hypothetical protein
MRARRQHPGAVRAAAAGTTGAFLAAACPGRHCHAGHHLKQGPGRELAQMARQPAWSIPGRERTSYPARHAFLRASQKRSQRSS